MTVTTTPGLIPPETIDRAAQLLLAAAPAGSEVILFGSYARGSAGPDSDLDFMVIEPTVAGRYDEEVRLRQVLRPLGVPVDVLVESRQLFEAWKGGVNSVIARAHREGKRYVRSS